MATIGCVNDIRLNQAQIALSSPVQILLASNYATLLPELPKKFALKHRHG